MPTPTHSNQVVTPRGLGRNFLLKLGTSTDVTNPYYTTILDGILHRASLTRCYALYGRLFQQAVGNKDGSFVVLSDKDREHTQDSKIGQVVIQTKPDDPILLLLVHNAAPVDIPVTRKRCVGTGYWRVAIDLRQMADTTSCTLCELTEQQFKDHYRLSGAFLNDRHQNLSADW